MQVKKTQWEAVEDPIQFLVLHHKHTNFKFLGRAWMAKNVCLHTTTGLSNLTDMLK